MKKKVKPYYEEWYFKEQSDDFTAVFLARILYDEDGAMTGELEVHLPGIRRNITYPYPVNMNLKGSLFVVLGKSVFTEACIHLDVEEPDLVIKGDLYFDEELGGAFPGRGLLQWLFHRRKKKIWAMEQRLSGELLINGREVFFDEGKGYLEERRALLPKGNGFWTSCNWFQDKNLRITCEGNKGYCLACIDQNGYIIRFVSYLGAKVVSYSEKGFSMRQRGYLLECWKTDGRKKGGIESTVRYRLSCKGDVLFDEISQRGVYLCDSAAGAECQ